MAGNLFTYGSLMCEDIMTSVAGDLPPSYKGVLKGYKRFAVKEEQYPGIVEQSAASVAGVVYSGLSEENWRRLDRFEGDMYDRRSVQVELEDSTEITAYAYVVKEACRHQLSSLEWDFEQFLAAGKKLFVNLYSGYGEIE